MAGIRPTTVAGATKLLWLLADYRAFAILAILRFSNLRFSYLLRLSKDDPTVGCFKAAQFRSTGQMLIRHIPRLIVGMYNGTECHLRTFSNHVNVSMLMLNRGNRGDITFRVVPESFWPNITDKVVRRREPWAGAYSPGTIHPIMCTN
jgi:hypothetical protein